MISGNSSMAKEPRRLRVYEQWQGNERFFCCGHCVTGPSWRSGMGTLVLLIAPTVIFLVFVAPYMSEKVTPAIMVISCVFPVFCMSMLLLTSCRDPGILPRQEPDDEWLQGRKPRAKDVAVNGHRVTVRYNDTCHFYQPPRAHHCSVNDNCIERFDHHCPWVGTTIGKRNYRTFLLFIYTTSFYIAWTFGVCLGSLFVKHRELMQAAEPQGDSFTNNLWLQTLSQSGAAIALMIFTFIFFWFVCGLSGFHTWLVATNQTTYENFRYNHNQVPNPYSLGFFRNCASVWCVRIPSSKVHFRAYIDEVQREPVELGYPEWNTAGTSPMRGPEGVAIEMQDINYGSGGSPGAYGGMSGEAMPPAQGYDSATEPSAQAPIGRTNGHSILGGDSAQPQFSPSETGAYRDERGFAAAAVGRDNGLERQQPGHAVIGSPPVSSSMTSYDAGLPLTSAGTAGGLAGTVQAMRAAGSSPRPTGYSGVSAAGEQQGHGMYMGYGSSGAMAPHSSSPVQPVAPDHVGIYMPAAQGAAVTSSSSSSRQQQGLPLPLAAAGSRTAGEDGSAAGGQRFMPTAAVDGEIAVAGAVSSAGTEYHDARRSQASWDSQENSDSEAPVVGVAKRL